MAAQQQDDRLLIPAARAESFATDLLIASAVPPAHAAIVARALVAADLRGIDTHGILRLPSYLERIRTGVLDPRATPQLTQTTPCVALVDGNNAFGFVAAHMGIRAACDMAAAFGIGLVSIRRSNHFGMSAWIVQEALARGMMSLVFTNSSPALPAFGSREKLLGVSPIACGAPGPTDFILDMAPSVAARGKVYKALRRGEQIPEGWALDRDGAPTTDPARALEGVMLPMGGPKGSALAIMMDVFSGVLSGSAFAGGVTGPYDPSRPADVGHFLVAIKPDLFVSAHDFRARMGVLYEKVTRAEKAQGVDRVWFPGEREMVCQQERERTGIPLTRGEVDSLNAEAARAGLGPLGVDV